MQIQQRTPTNALELVSSETLVALQNNRNFIGIELDEK